VHVGHAVIAVKLVLQRDPVFDRAQIGPERQIAAGLNAGKACVFFLPCSKPLLLNIDIVNILPQSVGISQSSH
jgi:hypothetical protein